MQFNFNKENDDFQNSDLNIKLSSSDLVIAPSSLTLIDNISCKKEYYEESKSAIEPILIKYSYKHSKIIENKKSHRDMPEGTKKIFSKNIQKNLHQFISYERYDNISSKGVEGLQEDRYKYFLKKTKWSLMKLFHQCIKMKNIKI